MLDHLIQVQQTRSGTTQTRTFSYMSGSTLTGYLQSATNPENGTVTYTYNSDGTLKTKTDNAGVVTGYTYDGQKRLLTFGMKVNGTITPAYTYTYDTGTYNKGRLATITYPNYVTAGGFVTDDMVVETYSYTQPGEVSQKSVSIGRCPTGPPNCVYASPLNISATYDNEGHRKTMTTPAEGFKYSYDQMERATGMTDAASGNTIVSGIQYGPANQLLQISYGSITETRTYNSLLQLTGINTGTVNLTYNYTAGQDNGKIASTVNNVSGEQVQYTYDSLNRLIQAQTTAGPTPWGQQFVYDGFGNLYQKNVTQGSAPSMSLTVNSATNQLTNTGGQNFTYDANGNMTGGPNSGFPSYDFMNRVMSANSGYYGYDASNRRIYKMTVQSAQSMTEVYYLYGLSGENLGTYTPTYVASPASFTLTLATARTYFFGKKLFTTEDNVGSAASNGTFFPYGEQKTGNTSEHYGFATYWQDSESGLDYAGSRYYSPALGRFLGADQYTASNGGPGDPKNPQSWNYYAYVQGDPINSADPSGQLVVFCNDPDAWSMFDGSCQGAGNWWSGGPPCGWLYGTVCGFFQPPPILLPPPSKIPPADAKALCEFEETVWVTTYLAMYHSPLAIYAGEIVLASNLAGIDDRFIVALAGVESRYGTTQNPNTWGQYNVFSNIFHCASLSNSYCQAVNPYPDYAQAIAAVLALLDSGSYAGLNSTQQIYSQYEEGNTTAISSDQVVLDQIYGAQLGGNLSNVRFPRCNGSWTGW